MRGLFMSPVIRDWRGDVQDCQGVSASEMTYIVSGEALNLYSLTHSFPLQIIVIFLRKLPIWFRLPSLWTASITFFGDNRRVCPYIAVTTVITAVKFKVSTVLIACILFNPNILRDLFICFSVCCWFKYLHIHERQSYTMPLKCSDGLAVLFAICRICVLCAYWLGCA